MSDEKIKTAAAKATLGLIPTQSLYGAARVFGYGAKKYAAGNYYQAVLSDGAGQRYISAALRHLAEMQLPNGLHTPESLANLDEESGLPHIDHILCGLMMLRSILVKCGALAVDPGQGKEPSTVEERANATLEPTRWDESDIERNENHVDQKKFEEMMTLSAEMNDELPTEKLVREARVASGGFDVNPPTHMYQKFRRVEPRSTCDIYVSEKESTDARPTGPGETGSDFKGEF